MKFQKYKPKKQMHQQPDGCIKLCMPMPPNPDDQVRAFYCAGEILQNDLKGTVTVCLKDGTEQTIQAGQPVPIDTNGFVIVDKVSMKMKFIPGKAPEIELPIIPESVQENFCAGDILPDEMIGKVDACLIDGTPICLASRDEVPADIDGWIAWDEVTQRAKWVQGKVTDTVRSDEAISQIVLAHLEGLPADQVRSDAEIKQIVQVCIDQLPEDQVRTDAEIIAIVNAVVGALPGPRTNAEIKSIAQACIDQLPPDQVRTNAEIQALAKAVVLACFEDLPGDQVRSDAEIKAIAQNCFNLLSADFLTAAQIYDYVDSRPDLDTDTVRSDLEIRALAKEVTQACIANIVDTDTVRSDLEIEGIANQVFKSCLALLPPDETRSDLEIMALAKDVFNECIANIDTGGIDTDQANVIAKNTFLNCINDYVRSDAEIIALVQQYIADLPEIETPRTDAEIKGIAQACIDLLPPDQVRTDQEIKVVVEACLALLPPDQVRTDAEINTLAKAVAQACIDQLPPDQVRSDTEIKAISLDCIENHPSIRTDAELQQFIIDFVGEGVTPRTDEEINNLAKIVAQACIDLLPPDQVRTNAEIKAIAQACIDLLPPDQVRSDAEIKAIAEACIAQAEDIDTFGVPSQATAAGVDVFGKSYGIGANIITYPVNRVVCQDQKDQPQVVRVSQNPAADLACVAECQYLYNCDNELWFQKVEGTYVAVPAGSEPSVGSFVGTLDAREFACKYEQNGQVYCHNYVQAYEHVELCIKMCAGNATEITFPIIETDDGSGFTINWEDSAASTVTYNSGDAPSRVFLQPYTGPIVICFDKCAVPTFLVASATGSFQYLSECH